MLSLISFLVLIGVLITAHELGHFVVAKLANVKVHTFSIGFGKALISKQVGETEYRIAWLPLGGYVKLDGIEKEFGAELGDEPERESPMGEEAAQHAPSGGRALGDKPAWVRALIFIAGPAMNLLLPFLLLPPIYLLSKSYDEVTSPTMGLVDQGLPAYKAGLRDGDLITEINGEPVTAFWQVVQAVDDYEPSDPALKITVQRPLRDEPLTVELRPERIESSSALGFKTHYNRIGFQPVTAAPDVAIRDPSGPFAQAGGQSFDRILSVQGEELKGLVDLERALSALPDAPFVISVERLSGLDERWPALKRKYQHHLTLPPPSEWPQREGSLTERLGVMSAMACISSIDPISPAAQVLKVGDCLVSVNGQANSLPGFFMTRLHDEPETAKRLHILRAGEQLELEYKLQPLTFSDPLSGEMPYWGTGFTFGSHTREGSVRPPIYLPNDEARWSYAWQQSTRFIKEELTRSLRAILGMFSGTVSPKHLGGPVTIFYLAGREAEAGWERFMFLMVMISMSIALINLLPVPGLDGGHILIASIEMIIRRRLPLKARMALQSVGVLLILALILFALGNDAMRMWRLSQGG